MLTLNAAILKPDATSTASGVYSSVNLTTSTCRLGTLPKAKAPQTNIVAMSASGWDAVTLKTSSMVASPPKIMVNALIGPAEPLSIKQVS